MKGPIPQQPPARTCDSLPVDVVRKRLTAVWLAGGGMVVALVVLQSLMGHYEDKTQEAWGWLLPAIMPSVGLIVGFIAHTALDPTSSRLLVRKTFASLAVWMSIVYLALILLPVLLQPIRASTPEDALQLMHTSNLWLGPMQGLVASALGVLFASKKDAQAEPAGMS